jgi:hypothetical protein
MADVDYLGEGSREVCTGARRLEELDEGVGYFHLGRNLDHGDGIRVGGESVAEPVD